MSQTQGPKKRDNQDFDWKSRFSRFFRSAEDEIKKTTAIGKKMLSASRTNTNLHDCYEKLGIMVETAVKNKTLTWEDPKVNGILKEIEDLKKELSQYEDDLQNIKSQK